MMPKTKKPSEVESLRGQVQLLNDELAKIRCLWMEEMQKAGEAIRCLWMEEMQKAGEAMSAKFDLLRVQKQNRIIEHIAAGRKDEAILEILDPAQLMINFKVVVADDGSRQAAESEMLERLKKQLGAHLEALSVTKETA